MKKLFAFSLLALAFAPVLARAAAFRIPAKSPIASFVIPDSWRCGRYDGGIESTSPDGAIYVALEMIEAKDVKSAIDKGLLWVVKQGVEIDPQALKAKATKINNLEAFDMQFTGRDKEGAAEFSLTLVATRAEGKFLLLYYWGAVGGEQANDADLQAITASILLTK